MRVPVAVRCDAASVSMYFQSLSLALLLSRRAALDELCPLVCIHSRSQRCTSRSPNFMLFRCATCQSENKHPLKIITKLTDISFGSSVHATQLPYALLVIPSSKYHFTGDAGGRLHNILIQSQDVRGLPGMISALTAVSRHSDPESSSATRTHPYPRRGPQSEHTDPRDCSPLTPDLREFQGTQCQKQLKSHSTSLTLDTLEI